MRLRYERAAGVQRLAATGPLVDVTLQALDEEGTPAAHAPTVRIDVLVDTGATFTVIDREVFDELGVLPSGMTDLLGVLGAPQSCPVYRVSAAMRVAGADKAASFHLPLRAIGIPPSMHRIKKAHRGLLGRDFLRTVSFLYDGTAGRFELYLDIEK